MSDIEWPAIEVELWPVNRILPYDKNPRTHSAAQVTLLASILQKRRVDQPIVVDEQGVILKGHGRRLAAIEAGFKEFPVVVRRGLSDIDKHAMRIEDNQIALLSGWDDEFLSDEVAELRLAGYDLSMLGFDMTTLESLIKPAEIFDEADEIPEPPKVAVSKRGDIWQLGRNRIMCGDCRERRDVDELLQDASVHIAFTSPPYAEQREYDKASGFVPIPPDDYVDWFRPCAENVAAHLAKDGSWFVNIKPGLSLDGLDTDLYVLDLVAAHRRKWGWHFVTEFCWERNGVPKAVSRRFKNQFEPVYQFARGLWKMNPESVMHESLNVPIPGGTGSGNTNWAKAQGNNGPMFGAEKKLRRAVMVDRDLADIQGKKRGLGVGKKEASALQGQPGASYRDAKRSGKRRGSSPNDEKLQGTSWQSEQGPLGVDPKLIGPGMAYPGNRLPTFGSTHEALGHAAAFPVGLPEFFIKAYSDIDDNIYDPFLGSGSTVIAAHRINRVGYGMEISPIYVDVAVERWQRLTGEKAKLLRTKKRATVSRRALVKS